MPLTLPTTTTTTNLPSQLADPMSTPASTSPSAISARLFRDPRWDATTSTRTKCGTVIVLSRGFYNLIFFLLFLIFSKTMAWRTWCLWPVLDQLAVAYAVSFLVDARGDREAFGRVVGERFFDIFMKVCAVVHALYAIYVLLMAVTLAIFFGIPGGFFMTVVGLLMIAVAWLASRPGDEDGALTLP